MSRNLWPLGPAFASTAGIVALLAIEGPAHWIGLAFAVAPLAVAAASYLRRRPQR